MDEEIQKLLKDIKQIEEVTEGLSVINSGKIDFQIYNFIQEIALRNKNIIHSIIINIERNNEILIKMKNINICGKEYSNLEYMLDLEGSKILSIFGLRDIIENIEVLCWLKINGANMLKNIKIQNRKNEPRIETEKDLVKYIEYMTSNIKWDKLNEYVKIIDGKERMKSYKISFKENKQQLEKELEKVYGRLYLEDEFKKIGEIKTELHKYIHKNGTKNINLDRFKYVEFVKTLLKNLKIIYKLYFKINFILDGTSISSSDYIECGEEQTVDFNSL